MTVTDFNIGDRFKLRGKGHAGSEYEVVGFWQTGERRWMDVRDINELPLASTAFCDENLAAFTERGEIDIQEKNKQ